MKKFLLLLLAQILLPISMSAEQQTALMVLTKDNVQHQFVIAEVRPQVTFEGNSLKVTCARESASAMFALSDVVRFTYIKVDVDGVDEQQCDPAGVNFENGMLVISQLEADASVCIYTTDGRLVQQLKARRSGTYRLSLSQLPHGVYLVKAGNTTYKIAKQ